jgi:hypothetical protein
MEPVDSRAYASVRIAFALSALSIWLDLWPLRLELFSNAGNFGPPIPQEVTRLNLFQWVSGTTGVSLVFAGVLVAIVCLGLGFGQRISALFVYLWFTSYSAAAALALGGFDTVARLTSFLVAVSPVSSAWTLPRKAEAGRAPRYGLRLLQWQLALIYWITVWLKAPDHFWRQGEVVSHFGVSMFARNPNPAFADLGVWDPLLTWGTLLIETLVPVLLWKRSTRWVGLCLGLVLHGTIAVLGKLELFSLSMLPMYLAFLEDSDFERFARLVNLLRNSGSDSQPA